MSTDHSAIAARLKRRYAAARSHNHWDDHSSLPDDESLVPILLSNRQVMDLLQERLDARCAPPQDSNSNDPRRALPLRRPPPQPHRHRDWIEQRVVEYVRDTAALPPPTPTTQFMHRLHQRFGLTPAEALQVLNLVPTKLVELHLIVEDLHDRMTGRKQEELLKAIQEHAAPPKQNDTTTAEGGAADIMDMEPNETASQNGDHEKRPLDADEDRTAEAGEKNNGEHLHVGDDLPSKKSRPI